VVVALAVGGTLAFAGIGLIPVGLGGAFLQYELLPVPDPVKYGTEGVEILGIGTIVAGVLMGLFFVLANGFSDAGGFADADAFDDETGAPGTGDDQDSDAHPTDDAGSTDAGTPEPPATDGGER